jgi:hypothetical protein
MFEALSAAAGQHGRHEWQGSLNYSLSSLSPSDITSEGDHEHKNSRAIEPCLLVRLVNTCKLACLGTVCQKESRTLVVGRKDSDKYRWKPFR